MDGKLNVYNQKRDFARTVEPLGQSQKQTRESAERLRFVVQHHMARKEHYDLRLEWDGALLSWAVPKGPSYNPADKRLAVHVEEHPLDYRNFEGTIPKGEYGGGVVLIWDEGFWEPIGDVDSGLNNGTLKFFLFGRRLRGKWALVRLRAKEGDGEGEEKDNWLLIKEKDDHAQHDDGIGGFITSIRTGRTMEQIERGEDEQIVRNPFDTANVQLAKLVRTVPPGEDWLYELKYDGYRILAYAEGSDVKLITRNGNDYSGRFSSIADSIADWANGRAMVLDGELAVVDAAGKTNFQALQNHPKNSAKKLTYIVFDLLALDGTDWRGRPLIKRKAALAELMITAPKNLFYSRHIQGNGAESLEAACTLGMEGIVGKKADSVYSGTRNGDWIKLKCDKRQEFVIGGYTRTERSNGEVSALLLGVYEGDHLVYAGRVGTGLNGREKTELAERFENLMRVDSPFASVPKHKPDERLFFLEPMLIAQVKFAEWTGEHQLRQASFQGLRTDKDPRDVRREITRDEFAIEEEKPMETSGTGMIISGVKITSPDKVLFEEPKVTKEDVIRYYAAVAERMLPYVSGRILSIVRCPKGIAQTCFYKKHPGPDSKGVVTVPIVGSDGKTEDYFYIENASGLISEAQMGTLEFHVWGSRVSELEQPDMMVFDLDPDEGMDLAVVRQGVRDLKHVLDELSLQSYLKTSGGKGYHVVVPLLPSATWDAFHDFARRVAEVMAQQWSDRYTSNVRKAKRADKIFIDWMRNGRGATSIAPYSIRARKGAAVSLPIAWDELDTVAPDGISLSDALKRMGSIDPWSDFFENRQRLR